MIIYIYGAHWRILIFMYIVECLYQANMHHLTIYFFVVRTLKMYYFSNFDIYNILTLVVMLAVDLILPV
jgi:hypothetical protein